MNALTASNKVIPSIEEYALINNLCSPLFNLLKIEHFCFLRIYKNKKTITLETNSSLTSIILNAISPLLEGRLYQNIKNNFYERYFSNHEISLSEKPDATKCHCLTLLKSYDHYHEIFNFSCFKPDLLSCAHNLSGHLDLLEHFCFYFKDQAENLITLARKNKPSAISLKETNTINDNASISLKRQFQEKTIVNRYFINDNTYLTKKELSILYLSHMSFR